jgi:hypothetical protein
MSMVLIIIGTKMYLARFPPETANYLTEGNRYLDVLKVNQWRELCVDYEEIMEGQIVDLPRSAKSLVIWEN